MAECPEVETMSQGDTAGEALANRREATDLFLKECPQPLQVAPALTDPCVAVQAYYGVEVMRRARYGDDRCSKPSRAT